LPSHRPVDADTQQQRHGVWSRLAARVFSFRFLPPFLGTLLELSLTRRRPFFSSGIYRFSRLYALEEWHANSSVTSVLSVVRAKLGFWGLVFVYLCLFFILFDHPCSFKCSRTISFCSGSSIDRFSQWT